LERVQQKVAKVTKGFLGFKLHAAGQLHPRQLVKVSVSLPVLFAFVFFCSETSPDPSVVSPKVDEVTEAWERL
jgi:hypothetical protein